jgi:hypothetical protein
MTTPTPKPTYTDIQSALTDLLFRPELDLVTATDRHFALDYRQRTDGRWDEREGFIEHIAHLRSIIAGGTVRVLDEFRDGARYADRHVVEIVKRDGSRVEMEVYVFAEFAADGRFRRVEETTLMLAGVETDRALGSAR